MQRIAACLVLALAASSAFAQSSYWKDARGRLVPDTESRKSSSDFVGALLATTDDDWQQKWRTPPETTPQFTQAETVPYGKKVYILTFFANPKLDDAGNSMVRCDLKVVAPTGQPLIDQKDLDCYAGPIAGSAYNMRLSKPVIEFSASPGEPAGIWSAEVMLRDIVRGVELPLRTTFRLQWV